MHKYDYLICGFGNSALGCIIGILENPQNSKILVLEKMSETDFFSNEVFTTKEAITLCRNDKTETLTTMQNETNRWNYSNILGLPSEYEAREFNKMETHLDDLNKKYQFVEATPDTLDPYIYHNFQNNHASQTMLLSRSSWDMLNRITFKDQIKSYIQKGALTVMFDCLVDTIQFEKENSGRMEASSLIAFKSSNFGTIKKKFDLYGFNENNLILSCGSASTIEILHKSGVGRANILKRNNIKINIENENIGCNLILNPYVETYYKEKPKNHFFIPNIETLLSCIERLFFVQLFIGLISYFLYNLIYTTILVSNAIYKIPLFVLLASLDSFFFFIFRSNNFMVFGYLAGFIYTSILFAIDSRYYVRFVPFFFVYWSAYYIFFVIYTARYYTLIGNRLKEISFHAAKIYNLSTILSFYKKDNYDEIIRSTDGYVYLFLNFLYKLFYYVLKGNWWIYRSWFIVRIEIFKHTYNAKYNWCNEKKQFIICTDFFENKNEKKMAGSFYYYEKLIENMYMSQKHSIYAPIYSKKSNLKSIKDNTKFSGLVVGSCATGKVVRMNKKLIGSTNVYITGLQTVNPRTIKKTINTTLSLLDGYMFAQDYLQ